MICFVLYLIWWHLVFLIVIDFIIRRHWIAHWFSQDSLIECAIICYVWFMCLKRRQFVFFSHCIERTIPKKQLDAQSHSLPKVFLWKFFGIKLQLLTRKLPHCQLDCRIILQQLHTRLVEKMDSVESYEVYIFKVMHVHRLRMCFYF